MPIRGSKLIDSTQMLCKRGPAIAQLHTWNLPLLFRALFHVDSILDYARKSTPLAALGLIAYVRGEYQAWYIG
jgi:hypothetical protein